MAGNVIYATSTNAFKYSDYFERTKTFNPDLDANVKLVRIQKWKYDPWVLNYNGMMDPISLICSLRNGEDERIQMCIDEVQGEIDKWQIMMDCGIICAHFVMLLKLIPHQ